MQATTSQLLQRFPETKLAVDVAFLQATAEAEAGQVQQGAARLTQFIDRGKSSPYYQQALLRRAHLYETNGEIEPAAKDYQAYLDTIDKPTPTSLQAGFRLMELLVALGKHKQVIDLATSVLQLSDAKLRTPEVEQEALYRLAVAQRFSGDLNKALVTHSRLTREHPINPYRAESVLEQGLIRMTQGDSDRGIPLLLDAVEREGLAKPSKISALRIVAQHDADNGKIGRSYDLRMKMQELGGAEVFSDDERLWLGDTLINRRKPKDALKYLAKVEGEASKERAMLLTGRAQRLAKEYDAAAGTLNEVRAISERYGTEAWLEIALTYRDMGKPQDALSELAPLQNPDRGHRIASRALYESGVIHQRLHMKHKAEAEKAAMHAKSAREAFKKLWLLYPDRAGEDQAKRAYLALAELQHASGDAVGEVKTLDELAAAHPDSAYASYAAALLAIRANQSERADSYLRQTIERAKQNEDVDLQQRADDLLRRER